jgi:hypothetical protein
MEPHQIRWHWFTREYLVSDIATCRTLCVTLFGWLLFVEVYHLKKPLLDLG